MSHFILERPGYFLEITAEEFSKKVFSYNYDESDNINEICLPYYEELVKFTNSKNVKVLIVSRNIINISYQNRRAILYFLPDEYVYIMAEGSRDENIYRYFKCDQFEGFMFWVNDWTECLKLNLGRNNSVIFYPFSGHDWGPLVRFGNCEGLSYIIYADNSDDTGFNDSIKQMIRIAGYKIESQIEQMGNSIPYMQFLLSNCLSNNNLIIFRYYRCDALIAYNLLVNSIELRPDLLILAMHYGLSQLHQSLLAASNQAGHYPTYIYVSDNMEQWPGYELKCLPERISGNEGNQLRSLFKYNNNI